MVDQVGKILTSILRDMKDGTFWIDIVVDGEPYDHLGPFDTVAERKRAHDDLIHRLLSLGSAELPLQAQ